MNLISQVSSQSRVWDRIQEPNKQIQLKIYSEPCAPSVVVNNLSSLEGPVDVYCWYEGTQCLPKLGATFLKESIFEPLYNLKQDAKLYLYSLKCWDLKKTLSTMKPSTPLGEAINRINKTAIECIYSSSFFQYCTNIRQESALYQFLSEELPKKNWLFSLSENQKKKGKTIAELFNERTSLFDCIKDMDVSAAYSPMQYVEGYYLIQESVRKGLFNRQKTIQIAFVLPNDESKYYLDYPKDIEKMLQMDFGEALSDVEINISFQFFEYGDSLSSRPYIDKRPKAPKVTVRDVPAYFDYLSQPSFSKESELTERGF